MSCSNRLGMEFSEDIRVFIECPSEIYGVFIMDPEVKIIGKNAFAECKLEQIYLQEGVEEIGIGAFSNCENLKALSLPSSLQSVGGATIDQTHLQKIYVPVGQTERIRALSPEFRDIPFEEMPAEGLLAHAQDEQREFRVQWAKENNLTYDDMMFDIVDDEVAWHRTKLENIEFFQARHQAWLDKVAEMRKAHANGAHTLVVDLEVFLGCSCFGGWNGDNQTVNMEVEDNVVETLLAMLENEKKKKKGDIYISDEELWDAIQNGHPELEPLHDELADRCHMMEVVYWCNEAYDCIDESLEPYFYQDVEEGLYEPETDKDFDQESGYKLDSFEACRDNYLEWVRSHDDDPYFMADRLGIDACECNSEYSFRIKEIK